MFVSSLESERSCTCVPEESIVYPSTILPWILELFRQCFDFFVFMLLSQWLKTEKCSYNNASIHYKGILYLKPPLCQSIFNSIFVELFFCTRLTSNDIWYARQGVKIHSTNQRREHTNIKVFQQYNGLQKERSFIIDDQINSYSKSSQQI